MDSGVGWVYAGKVDVIVLRQRASYYTTFRMCLADVYSQTFAQVFDARASGSQLAETESEPHLRLRLRLRLYRHPATYLSSFPNSTKCRD